MITGCSMPDINVLILSAGRQVMLVEAFRMAQRARGSAGLIAAADVDPFAPALAAADLALLAPRTEENGFVSWLEEVSICHAPLLILTLYERDLCVLEPMRPKLSDLGARLVGMPTDSLKICMDKQKLSEMCAEIGVSAPATWPGDSLASIPVESFPLMLKERAGRGSRGQQFARNLEELSGWVNADLTEFCIQQVITGTEFGLDVINDLEGRFVTVFAREKISMREGETAVARTADPERFNVIARALSARLAHQGCMDVDVIVSGDDVFLLDVNPRFGGGYPFSHLAGADLPAVLLCWAAGEKPDARWLQPQVGLLAAKASTVVRLHEF
jgi:carbamoyl-phosphate synthase large subunit